MDAIQRSIDILGAKRYLEIGVDSGSCFSAVNAPEKLGVDPISPKPLVVLELEKPRVSYFAQTSDDFFAQRAPQILTEGVDVVFIDGLHTFAQTYRDCVNAVKYLNAGGVILLHDCLPTSELEATPAESYNAAAALLNGIEWDGHWTGDSWKAIVTLRAMHPDLSACVLNCDKGLGFVYKGPNDSGLALSASAIAGLTYADLVADTRRLLGLRMPAYLLKILARLRHQRA